METKIKHQPARALVALREKNTGYLRVRQKTTYGGASRTLIMYEDGVFVENGISTIDDMWRVEPDRYTPIYSGDTLTIKF